MQTTLFAIALFVVFGFCLSFYMGWFDVLTRSDAGKSNVILSVDKEKIESDRAKLADKARDLGRKAGDAISPATGNPQD